MDHIIEGVRILLCMSCFVYASWSDYKTREVSNAVWKLLAPSAIALSFLQFFLAIEIPFHIYLLSFLITTVLALVLFYAGAFGGADAKALICLSLALPSYPVHLLQRPTSLISPIFPLSVLTNTVLLAAMSVFYALLRNLIWKGRNRGAFFTGVEKASLGRKILALLCGYKVNVSRLERGYLYPLEDVQQNEEGESIRKLIVFPKDEERTEIIERIKNASFERKMGNDVWVTPGLPLLIFITLGLIIALTFGDLIWIILGSLRL